MRAIHLTDLDIATRVLMGLPAGQQAEAARDIVAGARLADRFRKRLRRRHPVWGDGTLAQAALAVRGPAASPRCDARYRAAMVGLLAAIGQATAFDFRADALYAMSAHAPGDRDDGQQSGKPAQH